MLSAIICGDSIMCQPLYKTVYLYYFIYSPEEPCELVQEIESKDTLFFPLKNTFSDSNLATAAKGFRK